MADLKELRKRFAAAYYARDLDTMMTLYRSDAEV